MQSGFLQQSLNSIKDVLNKEKLAGGPLTQIGFLTYNSMIHYYNLNSKNKMPAQIIIPDSKDCDIPLYEGILVNFQESKQQIFTLLDSLPCYFKGTKNNGTYLISALEIGY